MSNNVTLEQVEQLAVQLPQQEQLKLFSRLSGRLTETIFPPVTANKKERTREAAAILRECHRAAAAFTLKTNSVSGCVMKGIGKYVRFAHRRLRLTVHFAQQFTS